jgi:hypothetical protein
MLGRKLTLLAAAVLILILSNPGSAYITITTQNDTYYWQGQNLRGNITITFDEYFDRYSVLWPCIDGTCAEWYRFGLQGKLKDPAEYTYKPQTVMFNIEAAGTNWWDTYVTQGFNFKIKNNGTCGSCESGECGNLTKLQGGDEWCSVEGDVCECPDVCTPLATNPRPCDLAGDCSCCDIPPGEGGSCHGTYYCQVDPYPCTYEQISVELGNPTPKTVDGNDGLKDVLYPLTGNNIKAPPADANDVYWYVIDPDYGIPESTSNPEVDVYMSEVCGDVEEDCNPRYEECYSVVGSSGACCVDKTGWVHRTLLCTVEQCIEENPPNCVNSRCKDDEIWTQKNNNLYAYIEPFYNKSLSFCYTRFGGPTKGYGVDNPAVCSIEDYPFTGGVFEKYGPNPDDVRYLNFYNNGFGNVIWDGDTGYIEIVDYNPFSEYYITYLPGNGPNVCAYTSYSIPGSSQWVEIAQRTEQFDYGQNPRTFTYTDTQLDTSIVPPPSCTDLYTGSYDIGGCTSETMLYGATLTSTYGFALEGNSTIGSPPAQLSVRFNTTFKNFTGPQSVIISLEEDLKSNNIKAPNTLGTHYLRLKVVDGGAKTLSSNEFRFIVCEDGDHDNYCIESSPPDCDDNDADTYPGAEEVCDGKDNDCDGKKDEDFNDILSGKISGMPCFPGTACSGFWVCAPNGKDLVCNGTYQPGQMKEICSNDVDDDCDGVTDEIMEYDDEGNSVLGCSCDPNGPPRECGPARIGICEPGLQICISGEWGECVGGKYPETEDTVAACNRKDDDCDGTVDNIGGKTSVEETQCRCYDGGLRMHEEDFDCNDIDDDCDGNIDEGLICCQEGATRECGIDIGECQKGVETCTGGSWYKSGCTGNIGPKDEICYNGKDEDCNGVIDDSSVCDPEFTCRNGMRDVNEDGVDCGGPCPDACNDVGTWMIVAGVLLLIITGIGYIAFTGKI